MDKNEVNDDECRDILKDKDFYSATIDLITCYGNCPWFERYLSRLIKFNRPYEAHELRHLLEYIRANSLIVPQAVDSFMERLGEVSEFSEKPGYIIDTEVDLRELSSFTVKDLINELDAVADMSRQAKIKAVQIYQESSEDQKELYRRDGKKTLYFLAYGPKNGTHMLDMESDDFFEGSCDRCKLRIPDYRWCARMPQMNGGWHGCYCSWNCVFEYINEAIEHTSEDTKAMFISIGHMAQMYHEECQTFGIASSLVYTDSDSDY